MSERQRSAAGPRTTSPDRRRPGSATAEPRAQLARLVAHLRRHERLSRPAIAEYLRDHLSISVTDRQIRRLLEPDRPAPRWACTEPGCGGLVSRPDTRCRHHVDEDRRHDLESAKVAVRACREAIGRWPLRRSDYTTWRAAQPGAAPPSASTIRNVAHRDLGVTGWRAAIEAISRVTPDRQGGA